MGILGVNTSSRAKCCSHLPGAYLGFTSSVQSSGCSSMWKLEVRTADRNCTACLPAAYTGKCEKMAVGSIHFPHNRGSKQVWSETLEGV